MTIEIDGNNEPRLYYVIHELVHVVFGPFISPLVDDILEEAMIVGAARLMHEYVKARKSRVRKWEDLIAKKLSETVLPDPSTMSEEVEHIT